MTTAEAIADAALAVLVVTSTAYAWRKRSRPAVVLAAMLVFTLAAELLRRIVLIDAPVRSAGWYLACALYLGQCVSILPVALVVLARRSMWPALLLYVAAVVVMLVEPRTLAWLYQAVDVVAVTGALACIGAWWWSDRPPDALELSITLIIGATAIGTVLHVSNLRAPDVWVAHAYANAVLLIVAAGLQTRGVTAS